MSFQDIKHNQYQEIEQFETATLMPSLHQPNTSPQKKLLPGL